MKVNYQLLMEQYIAALSERFSAMQPPTLLLHSCCAPCSSAVIARLAPYFKITVFYYNPNIDTAKEYRIRAQEQQQLIERYNSSNTFPHLIDYRITDYIHRDFLSIAAGFEQCPEGGERCFRCYRQRLYATAHTAQQEHYDFYCTTLSISPLKNAEKINEIGESYSSEYCRWLPSDFKKKNGYLESIKLSKEFNLYRQDYCGCEFSIQKS